METTKKPFFKLTRSESEIMELMWTQNRPLSRSEIIELTPDRSWKPASIHILLNSMLEKGAIEVAGFVQSTKNYARTFVPTVSCTEYGVMQIRGSAAYSQHSLPSLLAALVEDLDDKSVLKELEGILRQKKAELK